MTADQIEAKQREARSMFVFALSEFIARINAIDDTTPGQSEVPPSWWLQMSDLRRAAVEVRMRLAA